MAEAEFDEVAAEYATQHARSIRISGEDTAYFAQYKIADLRSIADERGVDVRRILDFGSGVGNSLQPMRTQFPDAHISCLDVSEKSLALCRQIASGKTDFHCYDGNYVPAEIGRFDIIFTACVFHHIPQDVHVSLLSQIYERLTPGGVFVLFEHNPWNPLTRHAVNTCPFDRNAVLISAPEMRRRMQKAGFTEIETRYRIFFPGSLSFMRRLEAMLTGLPLGAQYSLIASRK